MKWYLVCNCGLNYYQENNTVIPPQAQHLGAQHLGRVRGFLSIPPSTNLRTQENVAKVQRKCIPLSKFVCFEFSFKRSESITYKISLLFLVKISLQFCQQNLIRDFNPLSGKNDSAALYLFTEQYTETDFQKQPSRGVLGRKCSENVQQICRRTLMPKDD